MRRYVTYLLLSAVGMRATRSNQRMHIRVGLPARFHTPAARCAVSAEPHASTGRRLLPAAADSVAVAMQNLIAASLYNLLTCIDLFINIFRQGLRKTLSLLPT